MTLFAIAVITSFCFILINEKETIQKKVIEKKMQQYINKNYNTIKNEIKIGKIIQKNNQYTIKITSKKNKDYYFYIHYKNQKITNDYKTNYLQGKTFLTKTKQKIEKNIKPKIQEKFTVIIKNTLNQIDEKEKIITQKNPEKINFYTLQIENTIQIWTKDSIKNKIKETINQIETKKITPKDYQFLIKKEKEILIIKGIKKDLINQKNFDTIIKEILLNNKKSKIIKENNITYQYLKEE